MTTKEEEFKIFLSDPELKNFYDSRPIFIQDFIKNYPWKFYKMKPGSPYAINCEGTYVELVSWRTDGEISVGVYPEHLLPEAKNHLRELCEIYGKDPEEALSSPHRVLVDPEWLEPVEDSEFNQKLIK